MSHSRLNFIENRLSLRAPLRISLQIVADLVEELDRSSANDPAALGQELARIRAKYPTCTDFERDFVSIAFSIATGVGKTRLMGAIMAYLFLEGKSRNFFVLAPNLTIYEKLIKDFGDPGFSKYVFKGIGELANNPPVIITGDNYAQASTLFSANEMRINVFNISKFNKDTTESKSKKGGFGLPRIKRLSEYLGQSYWDYLTRLDDLVVLMDEAHRYHADKSKRAINELRPLLGIELTATPYVNNDKEKGAMFKNIVYEYSLAAALKDGKYIKEPAIATRQNYDPKNKTPEEIEQKNLESAISVHENTKVELQRYALESGRPEVKPFILVVCSDTTHAKEIYDYVSSHQFFNGQYAGKALQIDSTTRTTDEIENLFIGLESPNSPIEIVIHVNMLKEGWDVSNLYTIVPLRASRALILIEQTIGRGLRLPYGERTGDKAVDTLTVISHEHFDKIIAASKEESSVFNKMQYVVLTETEQGGKRELVVVEDRMSARMKQEQMRIATMQEGAEKQRAQHTHDATRAVLNALPLIAAQVPGVRSLKDLEKPEAQKAGMYIIQAELQRGQQSIFQDQILNEAEVIYQKIVQEFRQNIIEIPRLTLQPNPPEAHFEDFDLDTSSGGVESKFEFHVLDELIVREDLVRHERDYIGVIHGAEGRYQETPEQKIVAELLLFPEVSYDKFHRLLFKLSRQALAAILQTIRPDETVAQVVLHHKREISRRIYLQMKEHFVLRETGFSAAQILPFTRIEPWNITVPVSAGRMDYKNTNFKKSDIRQFVFMGYGKACHAEYTFDSSSELTFSNILEHDPLVEKWLRPAPNQFNIYWHHQTKKYQPDFVVETSDKIYMVEVKAANEVEDHDVLEKAKAAKTFCEKVSAYMTQNDKKTWHYLLIPHDEVGQSNTFGYLRERYG